MLQTIASSGSLFALWACLALAGQTPETPRSLLTGRCARDLPLDAGQGFDRQRFLVTGDGTWLFNQTYETPGVRWKLTARTREAALPSITSGPFRTRRKWRDGALWTMAGNRIYRLDPVRRAWDLKAAPTLTFMDFEVDMTGRILLVCTADPRTRTYRALLEAVEDEGKATIVLAPYPDPGCQAWAGKISPVAAASLQVGYEAAQILEFTLLFNPLSRRLFIFRPLEDRIQEVKLGLPLRNYPDLARPQPMEDLCWQVLPKDATEAWVVLQGLPGTEGLQALPLDLFEGTVGEPRPLPGLHLPLFPDPSGRLTGLEEALGAFGKAAKEPKESPPLPPSPG